MFETELKDEGITAWLTMVAAASAAPRGLMRAFAGTLAAETEKNFAAQGRPGWLGLKPRTLKRRGAGANILQDSGQLAGSIASAYGNDFARVGSNKPYAVIHQFGGTIERAPYSTKVRHRTNARGEMLRTEHFKGKGLVFAKGRHKRAVTRWFAVGAHSVNIPARPFLPADKNGSLQEAARPALEADIQDFLRSLAPA